MSELQPMNSWDLFLGDGIEALEQRAPDSCDHLITDPPYSAHTHENQRSGSKATKRAIAESRDPGFAHLAPADRRRVAVAAARVVRGWTVIFTDAEGIGGWREDIVAAGLEHIRVGAWIREGGAPQFTGDRPAAGFEAIMIAHRPGKKVWNGGGRQALWRHPIVKKGQGRLHPTEKPLGLMRALLRDFTNPGEVVLDPFAGSGSTIAACIEMGRLGYGWEQDPAHHAKALVRLRNHRPDHHLVDMRTAPRRPQGKLDL